MAVSMMRFFKWRALKTFQREWFRNDHPDFASASMRHKGLSVLIDNSRMHPRNAVVKLCEKDSAEVEHLFCDVLFAEDHGDLKLRQEHMDQFLDGMERLRIAYYPGSWSFKHDRHGLCVSGHVCTGGQLHLQVQRGRPDGRLWRIRI